MIRTCSVVIISQNELFTLREQICDTFLISNKKNNRGVVPVILSAIMLSIDTKFYSLS